MNKSLLILFLIIIFSTLTSALIVKIMYPVHFSPQPLLITDLIGIPFSLPTWIIYVSGILVLFLTFFLGNFFFTNSWVFLPVFLTGISPWFIYSASLGSFYIYLLCLLLTNILAIFYIKSKDHKKYHSIFISSSVLLLYSSLHTLIIYPLLIASLFITRFIELNKIKTDLKLLLITLIPLILLMIKNPVGLNNIYNNQFRLLNELTILDTVNAYQGESKRGGFIYLSKFSENKYVYTFRFFVLKLTKHFLPSTYFTPQEKLLTFSFHPPIYLGWLFPFLFGLYSIKLKKIKKYLTIILILIIPSFLSQKMVDLNRLIPTMPVIIFIICYGMFKLINIKVWRIKFILFSCIFLVMIQFVVFISDLILREYPRYEQYYGITNWQIRN